MATPASDCGCIALEDAVRYLLLALFLSGCVSFERDDDGELASAPVGSLQRDCEIDILCVCTLPNPPERVENPLYASNPDFDRWIEVDCD